jgi:hypothetical protein
MFLASAVFIIFAITAVVWANAPPEVSSGISEIYADADAVMVPTNTVTFTTSYVDGTTIQRAETMLLLPRFSDEFALVIYGQKVRTAYTNNDIPSLKDATFLDPTGRSNANFPNAELMDAGVNNGQNLDMTLTDNEAIIRETARNKGKNDAADATANISSRQRHPSYRLVIRRTDHERIISIHRSDRIILRDDAFGTIIRA